MEGRGPALRAAPGGAGPAPAVPEAPPPPGRDSRETRRQLRAWLRAAGRGHGPRLRDAPGAAANRPLRAGVGPPPGTGAPAGGNGRGVERPRPSRPRPARRRTASGQRHRSCAPRGAQRRSSGREKEVIQSRTSQNSKLYKEKGREVSAALKYRLETSGRVGGYSAGLLCQGHTHLNSDPGCIASYVGAKQENVTQQPLIDSLGKRNNTPDKVQPPDLLILQEQRTNVPGVADNTPRLAGPAARGAPGPGACAPPQRVTRVRERSRSQRLPQGLPRGAGTAAPEPPRPRELPHPRNCRPREPPASGTAAPPVTAAPSELPPPGNRRSPGTAAAPRELPPPPGNCRRLPGTAAPRELPPPPGNCRPQELLRAAAGSSSSPAGGTRLPGGAGLPRDTGSAAGSPALPLGGACWRAGPP
ncbi:WAS/WASL-interacting protein family member 2-like [Caloenas nicobarica]|uniref:WAS/WASL-interacting protein family member 2-like n=1 Tax=Caloenas nicobarica TaxID=187106 RepID=UPI0032B71E77